MTDDLENKPKKNNEIKKDEKPVKADATDKLKGTTTSSNKSKELKKDISEVDVIREAQKINNVEKNLRNKKITKKIFVSITFPGPISISHHPFFFVSGFIPAQN